jgi:undecaprenyl-diphosphatase
MSGIEQIDQWLLLSINGAHSEILDSFFWFVSGKLTWIPLYLWVLYLIYRRNNSKFLLWFLLGVVLTVALADITSAQFIKESFARYRPTHNLELMNQLHLHRFEDGEFYRGGLYGFVSNHATNFAVIAFWSFMGLRKYDPIWAYFVLFVALLVGYSRIYLGVHYPTDVVGGFLVGLSISALVYHFWLKLKKE